MFMLVGEPPLRQVIPGGEELPDSHLAAARKAASRNDK